MSAGIKFNGSDDEFRDVVEAMLDEYQGGEYVQFNNRQKLHWEYVCPNGLGKIRWYHPSNKAPQEKSLHCQGPSKALIEEAWLDAADMVYPQLSVRVVPVSPRRNRIHYPVDTSVDDIIARLDALHNYELTHDEAQRGVRDHRFRVAILDAEAGTPTEIELIWYSGSTGNVKVTVVGRFEPAVRNAAVNAFCDEFLAQGGHEAAELEINLDQMNMGAAAAADAAEGH